jgi:AraC-like DNA-binding protein
MTHTAHGLVHPLVSAVVRDALAAAGEEIRAPAAGDPTSRAEQRRLLDRLLTVGGGDAVLRAGRHLDRLLDHPLALVLLNSDSVPVLLGKLERLNRYFHSHHRHRVLAATERLLELEHVSLSTTPPAPVESLFVCGLYLTLLERVGCRSLRLALPAAPSGEAWVFGDGATHPVPTVRTGRWRFVWDRFEMRRALPRLDELLLRDLPADLEQHTVASQATGVMRRDLGRPWSIRQVAGDLALSARTLQRRLHDEGTTFTRVVRQTRVDAAARLLTDPSQTVSDIGYAVGFADTAHFTRTFKAATGVTPSQWRRGEGPSPASTTS